MMDGATVAELFEYQPLVNDLRAILVERTSHAAWVLCVPSGDYGMVLDATLATRPTANGEGRPELVLTYVKFPTEVDIVALKVALEHWQRDAHTWPPPSWDTWDKEQWTRDQLTRVVRGSEALRSRVWQNSSDWGAFWRFQNEVESAVFEFLQALGPPSLQPPWRRSVPITDVELATTLPDHSE